MLSRSKVFVAVCLAMSSVPASAQQDRGDDGGGALFGSVVGGLIGGAIGAAVTHRSPRGADVISAGGHPPGGGPGGGAHRGGQAAPHAGGMPHKKH